MAGKGQPKTGGRKKGTPNKTTTEIKTALSAMIGAYFEPSGKARTLTADIATMTPTERAVIMAKLTAFVLPKQQAVTIEEQTQIETAALTQLLETAPEETINAIAAKVLELQAANQDNTPKR